MQNQFIDIYRNGIKTVTEVTRTSLESLVQLQERQIGIVRNLLDESRRNAESLAEAKSIEDLMAQQSRFAGSQLEKMAEFWSSTVHAVAEQQKAWIDRMQSQVGQTRERVRETYDLTARTSEEIARTAANQVSRATGSVREAASATQEQQRRKSA
ncbi:MAG: phasin family protein [Betaproteobacteria bacterium]|nr:phasin family protein [Betaproteobacteria bacterium]